MRDVVVDEVRKILELNNFETRVCAYCSPVGLVRTKNIRFGFVLISEQLTHVLSLMLNQCQTPKISFLNLLITKYFLELIYQKGIGRYH